MKSKRIRSPKWPKNSGYGFIINGPDGWEGWDMMGWCQKRDDTGKEIYFHWKRNLFTLGKKLIALEKKLLGSLVSWSSGPPGPPGPLVLWSSWSSGPPGPLVLLVPWSSGPPGPLVLLVLWSSWSSTSGPFLLLWY